MDRIINNWERTISPSSQEGINTFLSVIDTIATNSLEPIRQQLHNIPQHLRSPKECLAMTATMLRKNRLNWMSIQELPEGLWLNSGVLTDTCRQWNYSRWSITPVLSQTQLSMEESTFSKNSQASVNEWIQILSSNMLCHELDHFYTRKGALSNDFQTAIERCISQLLSLIHI